MRKTTLLAAAALAWLIAVPAQASDQGYYIRAEGGVTIPPDHDLVPLTGPRGQDSFDSGYIFGAAAGYDFGNGARLELEPLTLNEGLTSVNGTSSRGHLDASGIMFGGSFDLFHADGFTPYAGAGIGALDVGAELNGVHGDNWEPAYQLKAGLSRPLGDNVDASLEYRFLQSESSRIDGLGNQHFTDHAVLVGLTYHLGQ